jgi:hypothetical protein
MYPRKILRGLELSLKILKGKDLGARYESVGQSSRTGWGLPRKLGYADSGGRILFPCGVGRGRISKIGWTRKAPDAGAGFAEVYEGNCKERVEENQMKSSGNLVCFPKMGMDCWGGRIDIYDSSHSRETYPLKPTTGLSRDESPQSDCCRLELGNVPSVPAFPFEK